VSESAPPLPSRPATGCFLVASPGLMDPNFTHAVVLICRHGTDGTYGLIVNRRTNRNVSHLESDAALLTGRTDPLFLGGPVADDTLQILHRSEHGVPGGLPVLGDTVRRARRERPVRPGLQRLGRRATRFRDPRGRVGRVPGGGEVCVRSRPGDGLASRPPLARQPLGRSGRPPPRSFLELRIEHSPIR
jgi:hypothetical protein